MLVTILVVIMLVVAWLLLVPVSIVLNAASDDYRIQQTGTFRFRMIFDPAIKGELTILGLQIRTGKRGSGRKKEKKPKEKMPKTNGSRSLREWTSLGLSMVRTIRVNRFIADIDTGDVVMNAQLVPVFLLASRAPAHLATNFEGRVLLDINISFYVYKAVVAFLRFKLKI